MRKSILNGTLLVLGLGTMLASKPVGAAVITTDLYNVDTYHSATIDVTGNGGDLTLTVDGFGIVALDGTGGDSVGIVTDGTANVSGSGTPPVMATLPVVKSLSVGSVVGPSDTFTALTGFQNALLENVAEQGEFPASPEMPRYFGFEVTPAGSSTPEYGYGKIETINDGTTTNDPNGTTPLAAEVISFTYNSTPGTSVNVMVPEPASLALIGIVGVASMSRRRKS